MKFKSPKKSIRLFLLFRLLKLKNYKIKDSIIIFSEPRSGSTWLMENLAKIPKTIPNFEPLQIMPEFAPKKYSFEWKSNILENTENPSFYSLFVSIICYEVFNKYTTQNVSFKKVLFSKHVITKFVLGNQLLPWFTDHFKNSLDFKPIFLVRHPLAVCISQLKNFNKLDESKQFNVLNDFDELKIPNNMSSLQYKKNEAYLKSLSSKIEIKVAEWCIINSELINNKDSDWVMVYYEDLLMNPKREFNILLKKTGLNIITEKIEFNNFYKPSSTVFRSDFKPNPVEQLNKFLKLYDKMQLQKIQEILDHFSVTKYSAFNPLPIKD